VIGSNSKLTGFGGGLPMKQALLEHEARVSGKRLDLFG
jgi:O6-methylguanine-DNA--protein-cysteine methyltransferase